MLTNIVEIRTHNHPQKLFFSHGEIMNMIKYNKKLAQPIFTKVGRGKDKSQHYKVNKISCMLVIE